MNSLLGYGNGSDDDLDESPEIRQKVDHSNPRSYKKSMGPGHSQDDTNYDEVQMSLSEDSDSESKCQQKYGRDRAESTRNLPSRRSSRDEYNRERSDGPSERAQDRSRCRDKEDTRSDRPKAREEDSYKPKREEDRTRERYERCRDDDRGRERRDDKREGSRERYVNREDRYRKDRDRRRSRSPRDSRDRRRSRSPRRNDRSRSRSRERGGARGRGGGGFQRRLDRAGMHKMDRNAKPENKTDEQNGGANDDPNKARFFMPGITGRFRDQIEKRKLLWQKKEPESKPEAVAVPVAASGSSRTTKVWEATTFAQDTDGKVANKFKRLMGIRGSGEGNSTGVEVLKKQEEMFTSMEQQYEVARTATHTMRGVGLGFGSYPR